MSMYAIHLADLLYLQHECFPLALLLASVVSVTSAVEINRDRFGDVGVAFTCDDDRAEAIIELIRMHYNLHTIRIYRKTKTSWRKV